MIRYALQCDAGHPFEAWFGSSADYDDQAPRGLIECPWCASHQVKKQIMAPAIATGRRDGRAEAQSEPTPAAVDMPTPETPPTPALPIPPQLQAMMMEAASKMRAHVEKTFDYVGDRFAREARDIHEGSGDARPIYGEATSAEVRALEEDGIPVAPLPAAAVPREKRRVN